MATDRVFRSRSTRNFSERDPSHLYLTSVTEQRCLKEGLTRFQEALVVPRLEGSAEAKESLLALPRRSNGTPVMMRHTWFNRLLRSEIELQGTMANDVAIAQPDLQHLTLEQLLLIRSRTLDFATLSKSHEAHINFLHNADKHLFAAIARSRWRGIRVHSALFVLGRYVTQLLGGFGMLDAAGLPTGKDGAALPGVPRVVAFDLEAADVKWSGRSFAIFDLQELWIDPLPDDDATKAASIVAAAAKSEQVGVLWDRSTGRDNERLVNWEIKFVCAEEVLPELKVMRATVGVAKQSQRDMDKQLSGAVLRRTATAEGSVENAAVSKLEANLRASQSLRCVPRPFGDSASELSKVLRGRRAKVDGEGPGAKVVEASPSRAPVEKIENSPRHLLRPSPRVPPPLPGRFAAATQGASELEKVFAARKCKAAAAAVEAEAAAQAESPGLRARVESSATTADCGSDGDHVAHTPTTAADPTPLACDGAAAFALNASISAAEPTPASGVDVAAPEREGERSEEQVAVSEYLKRLAAHCVAEAAELTLKQREAVRRSEESESVREKAQDEATESVRMTSNERANDTTGERTSCFPTSGSSHRSDASWKNRLVAV
eukprot:TRINITY_DN34893_c0_g1_i1.p1 TRINITY_DN34893_c0_g1~~TRINITY_DN34893_c0_g1_i1.p1  ORF type:complete len:606 (+),score=131.00 TRINITY_DN34893_c0_g1_i1:120-1937(+)